MKSQLYSVDTSFTETLENHVSGPLDQMKKTLAETGVIFNTEHSIHKVTSSGPQTLAQ